MSNAWNQTFSPDQVAARFGDFTWDGNPFGLRINNELGNVSLMVDPNATDIHWELFGLPEAASRVQIFMSNGVLHVDGVHHNSWVGGLFWRSLTTRDGVDIRLVLPIGLRDVVLEIGVGDLAVQTVSDPDRSAEILTRLDAKLGKGNITVDRCSALPSPQSHNLKTGVGNIWAGIAADLTASTGVGDVRFGLLAGDGSAKTGTGNVLIERMTAGSLNAATGVGDVRVSVPPGTAAFLDCSTGLGEVKSDLRAVSEPSPDTPRVTIAAKTGMGAVRIRYA